MTAICLAFLLCGFTHYPPLKPHSIRFGLVSVTDSIHLAWTMPDSASSAGHVALHSWMTPELWWLPQFLPGWPVKWNTRTKIWTGPLSAPNSSQQAAIPVYGYGSVWLEIVGPGGRSPRSNNQASKLN